MHDLVRRLLDGLVRALPLLMLAGVAGAQVTSAPDFPRRKPGLWEIRSTAAHASGLAPTQYCVGDATDVESNHLDRANGQRGACMLGAFQRAGTAWVAESVCKEGKTVVLSRAVASGDLQQEYRIDTHVTYDPPLAGIKREDKEAVVARYLGDCPAGQRAGDMTLPGVGVLNMVDGKFRAERDPPPARPRTRPAP